MDKIYYKDFDRMIDSMDNLNDRERAYVKGAFSSELKSHNSLSRDEVRKKLYDLEHNLNDPLDRHEFSSLKEKLTGMF